MPELRWHPLLEEWVAVSATRQGRPIALGGKKDTTPVCPFCPGGAEGLNMPFAFVTFDNKFPSLWPGSELSGPAGGPTTARRAKSAGTCEVVLYSPKHDSALVKESQSTISKLVEVWADRYRELGARRDVKYVYIFENKGEAVGVTLTHPHGQIYAFPFIPPRIKAELAAEARHHRKHRRCLHCDLLKAELQDGRRIVASNGRFVAYVPFAARYPYEVHLVPRRHAGAITDLTSAERWDLAGILRTVIRKYDNLWKMPFSYMMLMHQRPTDGKRYPGSHFHVEFYPPHRTKEKIKFLAGCESGAGTFINDTIPEEKAAELRRVPPRA